MKHHMYVHVYVLRNENFTQIYLCVHLYAHYSIHSKVIRTLNSLCNIFCKTNVKALTKTVKGFSTFINTGNFHSMTSSSPLVLAYLLRNIILAQ